MHLYLVRHGEMDNDAERRYGDFPLSEKGCAQVARLALRLRNAPLTHIYSSPLHRAHQTAQMIAALRNLTVAVLDDLREVDIGALNGLTYHEARKRYPWFYAQSRVHPTPDFRWPEGETTAQVLTRARRTWEHLWGRHKDQDDALLVVSHTYYLNVFLLAALGLDFPNRFTFNVEPAGCVHVAAENGLPPWIVFDSA